MVNQYDIGTKVRLIGEFRDLDNVLSDPTVVVAKTRDPSGNVTTISGGSVTKDSTGVYHVDVTLDESGTWWYRFEGTGAVVAADEQAFVVAESRFV